MEQQRGKTVRVWNPEKTTAQNVDFTKRDASSSTDDFDEYLKARVESLKSRNSTPKKLEEGAEMEPKQVDSAVVSLVSRIKSSLILYLVSTTFCHLFVVAT
jgi:hypothetical protein